MTESKLAKFQHNLIKTCCFVFFFANSLNLGSAYADEAIIIGGGYNLLSSQGQIELNVKFATETLNNKGVDVTTYFTDGMNPGNDVYIQHAAPLNNAYDALSRVFGDHLEQRREYRSNALENVSGSTQRNTLLPNVEQQLSKAKEPVWLIYNGHGNQSHSSPDQVTMELWDNTRVTANELHGIVEASDQPVRYAFTQCYSGGFHALAYDTPNNSLTPASPQRCGFTAVSAYSLAEGCSASIDTSDYRDYTTHFFAALSGFERDGSIIYNEPDTNTDGQVSPREAHLYTLLNAKSTDISRSTSEDFLERWEPWYLRWTPGVKDLPSNEYAKLFRELATKSEIPLDQHSVRTIRIKQAETSDMLDELSNQYTSIKQSIFKLQNVIAKPIVTQWPAILGPFSKRFQKLSEQGELDKINQLILADENFTELATQQNKLQELENQQLQLAREAANLEKLLHLRKIATLKQQLVDFGSDKDNESYNSFVQCEEMPITSSKGTIAASLLED